MKILVINAGSSSIKYQLINEATEELMAKGTVEKIGLPDSQIIHKAKGETLIMPEKLKNHSDAMQFVLKTLQDENYGVIKDLNEIDAIGHRVVHGGSKYNKAALVTEEVLKDIDLFTPLAPLHNPPNKLGIMACSEVMPTKPNVVVFDTAFHSTMPDYAYMYPLPYAWYENHDVRRYGFHGTSHEYIVSEVFKITKEKNQKIISCHIGNGASIAAVKNGKCVDTSMGLTPLEGLMMGTRCGDIDPAIIEYMGTQAGIDVEEITNSLNKKSGLFGVSGISNDIRDVTAAAEEGNERAKLAIKMFFYRIKKYIGTYSAVLGGADVIVFTAGSGENRPSMREAVLKDMQYMGIELDTEANNSYKGEALKISAENSKVAVYVIPTDEELSIAKQTKKVVVSNKSVDKAE